LSLRRQSALIFATSLVQLVFLMIAGILTARYLGPEGKGIALLAFYLPGFLASLGSLSIGESATYDLGRGLDARRVVSNTIQLAVGLGLLYALACLALLEPLRQKVVADVPTLYLVLGLVTLPLMLLKNYGDGMLVALKRVNDFVIGNLLLHTTRAVGIFLALVVLDAGVRGAVIAEFVAWLLSGAWYLRGTLRGHGFDWRFDTTLAKGTFAYSGQSHLGNMAMRANHQVSTFFLSSLRGAGAVGLFSIVLSFAQMLWYLPDAVGRILFPRVAGSSREEGALLTAKVCRNTLLVTAFGCLLLALFGRWIIVLFYGDEFAASFRPLLLLMPGILAMTLNRVLTKYLSGIGRPFLNAAASIVSFVVNVPLLLWLVGLLGIDGAAIATSVAYCVNGLVVLALFLRESRRGLVETLVPTGDDLRLYVDAARSALARVGLARGVA
jgi:O-antigen/teichoic acid export membrane protein